MPVVRSQGLSIHYEVVGRGPPILMHHGVMGRGAMWKAAGYLDELKDEFSFILMDARGHGQSDKPHDPAAYEGRRLAEDVLAVLDDIAAEQAIYWGYSLGGRIGYELAGIAPERVSAFIIGGSTPYAIDLRVPVDGDSKDQAQVRSAILDFFGVSAATLSRDHQDALFANDFLAVHAVLSERPSIASVLAGMTMPCLIYVGGDDPRADASERAASELPNATFARLPGLDHGQAMLLTDHILPHVEVFLRANAAR
ncbi:MAG: alpha/beta fold hydrolase [Pseudomonadota bacterium]